MLFSVMIISLLMMGMIYLWYPSIFFEIEGGWEGAKIVIFVDIILGPLLTFVIYNPAKPELRRDIMTIVFLQLTCFSFGGYIVYRERPLAVVFYKDSFITVVASSYANANVSYAYLDEIKGRFPKTVFVNQQTTNNQSSNNPTSATITPPTLHADLTSGIEEHQSEILMHGFSKSQLEAKQPQDDPVFSALWDENPKLLAYRTFGSKRAAFCLFSTDEKRFYACTKQSITTF